MKLKSHIRQGAISLGVLFLSIMLLNKFNPIDRMNLNGVIEYVSSKGKFGEIAFLILFAVKPILLIIPSSIFSIAAGILFGPMKGLILNFIGFFISSTFAFYLSRWLGKSFVDKIIKGKLLKIDKTIEENGFIVIFMLRFPPIFPYDMLSITAGITRIKYSRFIMGSLLGIIPETLCYTFMGKSIRENSTFNIIILFLFMIVILITTIYIYRKMNKRIVLDDEQVG